MCVCGGWGVWYLLRAHVCKGGCSVIDQMIIDFGFMVGC